MQRKSSALSEVLSAPIATTQLGRILPLVVDLWCRHFERATSELCRTPELTESDDEEDGPWKSGEERATMLMLVSWKLPRRTFEEALRCCLDEYVYIDPVMLVPYALEMYDKATYEAMRAFREPVVTVHYYGF